MKEYKCKGYKVYANSRNEAVLKFKDIWENEVYGMSNLFPSSTGLDVPIYVDDGGTYKKSGHGKRIKFKASLTKSTNLRNAASMKLNGELVEETLPKKASDRVDDSVIDKVRTWVLNNSYALSKMADKLIDIAGFLKVMVKGSTKITEEQSKNIKNKVDKLIKEN